MDRTRLNKVRDDPILSLEISFPISLKGGTVCTATKLIWALFQS